MYVYLKNAKRIHSKKRKFKHIRIHMYRKTIHHNNTSKMQFTMKRLLYYCSKTSHVNSQRNIKVVHEKRYTICIIYNFNANHALPYF